MDSSWSDFLVAPKYASSIAQTTSMGSLAKKPNARDTSHPHHDIWYPTPLLSRHLRLFQKKIVLCKKSSFLKLFAMPHPQSQAYNETSVLCLTLAKSVCTELWHFMAPLVMLGIHCMFLILMSISRQNPQNAPNNGYSWASHHHAQVNLKARDKQQCAGGKFYGEEVCQRHCHEW